MKIHVFNEILQSSWIMGLVKFETSLFGVNKNKPWKFCDRFRKSWKFLKLYILKFLPNEFKMTNESKQSICVICSNVCENGMLVHNLTVEDEEGNILNPLDLLLKYTDVQIPKSSLCCADCDVKLKKFAILEKSYYNLFKVESILH